MRNNRLPEPVIRVKQPALARFSPDVSPLFVHFRADDDVPLTACPENMTAKASLSPKDTLCVSFFYWR
ncbi:hypothetical protein Asd1617_00115 [Shigella dysenteriae 1617]|uniref:Uncharacterized protein n=1 Tax=Shigella dysenteriae 1617 TaxID=754093 RepID=A0A0A6ZLT0_SHIDY|nr:hypothetical protein Asd1617_00115 [Shigella dysenteriae 1617]